jgi:hypothetical protein
MAGADIVTREADYVRVPGIVEGAPPVRVFEVMGMSDQISADKRTIRDRYLAALALYRARQFAAARPLFEELEKQGDGVSAVYIGRCMEYESVPPAGELIHEIHGK